MEGGRTVEAVFKDFKGRRNGIIKALTTDFEDFFPAVRPCEQWEVNLPEEEVPPELPEPALGINFVRDRMQRKEWKRLFNMINDLQNIFDVISAPAIKHPSNNSNNKSKPNIQRGSKPQAVKYGKVEGEEEEVVVEEEEEEDDDTLCGFCGEYYESGQFWIYCDLCERWFHGKCVRITPAKAKTITHYKCPICNGHKRQRP
nr:hypothetical protein [Tanacetum cinerariifolium]